MGEYDSKVVSFQQESGFVHQRALMNWRAGNYPDALNLIRKAVESDPTDARCRLDMARILVSMELYEAAGRQLMWLLSEARELEESLFLSGKILYARGRQEEAEHVLRAYVDHSGGHESVEEAERMLDRIYLNSEIQQDMAEDRHERRVQKLIEEGIRQLETLGDSRSSEQAFGHAVRLNPLRVSAHALYAVVLNLNGKPEDARREAIMAGRLLGPSAPLPDVCICAQALYESGMREEG
ncbi:MAG: tetratricopeptide repeat protein, partial [Clostridia bacterium]|nr:tetratricopeptide repeat protein [Clostridia bacterium]